MKHLLLLILSLFFLLSVAKAAEVKAVESDAQKYETCLAMVERDASAALTYAEDWIFSGAGGVPAGHCKALALLEGGKATDAALLLEKLVDDMAVNTAHKPENSLKNSSLKTQLFVQAALAWKEAKDLDKSYMAYSSALSGIEKDSVLIYDLYVERGTLQIMRGQYRPAIKDLTLAMERNAQAYAAFFQRAKAYRKIRQYLKARLDLKMTELLWPNQPEVSLERGILYRSTGNKLAARKEWQKIIDNFPKSGFAALAQTNIDLLAAP